MSDASAMAQEIRAELLRLRRIEAAAIEVGRQADRLCDPSDLWSLMSAVDALQATLPAQATKENAPCAS